MPTDNSRQISVILEGDLLEAALAEKGSRSLETLLLIALEWWVQQRGAHAPTTRSSTDLATPTAEPVAEAAG
jgi:hypothetical protein